MLWPSRRIRSLSPVLNTGDWTTTTDARAKALEPPTVAASTLWHVGSRKVTIAIALKSIFIVYSNPDLIPALLRANLVIERSSTIVLILRVEQTLAAGLG